MLGIIIIGVLLTLSQVIESYQKVTYDHGPMMEMLPDGTTQISDEHRMATTRVPVYSFIPFLNTYYLHWVLVIGIGLVTASVVCFAKYRRKIKTKKKSKKQGAAAKCGSPQSVEKVCHCTDSRLPLCKGSCHG